METAGTPKRASRKTLISQDSFRADRMKHAATRFRRLFEIQSGLDLVSRLPAQSSHRMNIHQTAATTSILMCSAVFGILKIQIGLTIRRTSPRMNFQSAFLRKLNLTGSDSDNQSSHQFFKQNRWRKRLIVLRAFPWREHHSIRRAVMGEMEAARVAGITAAMNEHSASAPAANVSASGSHEETP